MVFALEKQTNKLAELEGQKCDCCSLTSGYSRDCDQPHHHHYHQHEETIECHLEEAAEEGKNLDSGYAWFILLIMFLLQSSISGASRVYGIVYAKEVSIGYYDREQASWPIASASAVENLAGILTPTLASFLSWRQIELLSTSLFICANLLAYFSNSLTLDIIALGLIQGLALSTCTVLSLVINNDYFERYRTTAYGIQMSGSTFGVLYLSPLVSWLLAEYDDFRVVYLALAIVFCANIFLVLFIKPRAKTINSSTGKTSEPPKSMVKCATASDQRQLDIERVKKFLESLDSSGRQQQQQQQKMTPASCNQQQREPLSRKRSRFESHFERQNSIASISYEARSRRQSVYSRRRVSVRAQPSSNSIYSIEGASNGIAGHWPSAAADKIMIIKSKSGVDLASKLSGRALPADGAGGTLDAAGQPPRRQRISLNQMHSSPLVLDNHHQLSHTNRELRRHAKLSVTNSLNKSQEDHSLRSPLDDAPDASAGAETTCQLADDNAPNFKGWTLGANNASSLDVTDLEGCVPGPHDLSSRPSMLLHNQQQYPNSGARKDASENGEKLCEISSAKSGQSNESRGFSWKFTVRLLKLPYLHCTWMMLALYYLIARIFVIILVDFADDHGFSASESTYLLNYWSLGELVGRILLGSLIDLQYLSCKNCIVLTCTLLASFISCMVLVESYIVYAVCSMCIAALISLEYMLINVLMVEYVGKEHVTNCYSLAACISSLVLFSRPSLIGLFRDQLGSYDGLLILLASLPFLLSIIFYVLEPVLVRRWPKRLLDDE